MKKQTNRKQKSKRPLFLSVFIVGLLAAVVAFLLWDDGEFAFEYDWPKGSIYVYDLDYSSESEAVFAFSTGGEDEEPQEQSYAGLIDMKGELRLASYGKEGAYYLLGVTFSNISTLELTALGSPVFESEEEAKRVFESSEALMEINGSGEISALKFEKRAHPAFVGTVQSLMGDVQVIVESGSPSWEAREKNQQGEAVAEYEVLGSDGDAVALGKKREDYKRFNAADISSKKVKSDVTSSFDVALHEDGYLKSLAGTEVLGATEGEKKLLGVTTEVSVVLSRVEQVQSPDELVASLKGSSYVRALGEVKVSPEAEQKALVQRAAGMKIHHIVEDITKYGSAGRMPFHERWIWRATGLLRASPEECKKLLEVFEDESVGATGKQFIVELLAGVGNEEAQKVMLEIFDSDTAKSNPGYFKLIQRVAVLTNPTVEMGKYIEEKVLETQRLKDDLHFSSAFALGSMSAKLRENGEEQVASALNERLVEFLKNAENDDERAAYLRALGNSGDEKNIDLIAPYSADADDRVRRAVATALRKTRTPESEKIVMTLASDSVGQVQKEALQVLRKYTVDSDQLLQLDQMLESGGLDNFSRGDMITLLHDAYKDPSTKAMSEKMLKAMLAKTKTAKLRQRISGILNG